MSDVRSYSGAPPEEEEPVVRRGVFRKFLEYTFAFQRLPFTLVFVLVYLLIGGAVWSIQETQIPRLSAVYPHDFYEDAWTDLQIISRDHHPFLSHANDAVHDYILDQVRGAVDSRAAELHHVSIEVENDWGRKAFFAQKPVFDPTDTSDRVQYYEGNNVLVRIEGRNSSLGSVLISAHYDSVPTGYGTTDDGVGTASMLGTLRYLLSRGEQPLRSIIFNFNNNEEFGLLGAEVLRFHPWYDEIDSFINLEGAGALGRPVLFRATDYGVAKHFSKSPNPHANSVLQQGFQSGLVHSQTDYKVYADSGIRGVDIAFYKSRSLYHSLHDSIHGSSIGALSHMMNSAIGTLLSLSNDTVIGRPQEPPEDLEPALFLDLFDFSLFIQPVSTIVKWNSLGLIMGPIIVGLLLALVSKNSYSLGYRGWVRGILALVSATAAGGFAVAWLYQVNPLVFVSRTYTPLISLFSIFLLVAYPILGLASYLRPVHDQKLIVLLELLSLWWIALLVVTVIEFESHATGYLILTFLYYFTALGVAIGLMSVALTQPWRKSNDRTHSESGTTSSETAPEPTERSSLLSTTPSKKTSQKSVSLGYDWSLQFLAVVPFGLYVVLSTGALVLDSMHQTLIDGTEMAGFLCVSTLAIAAVSGLLVSPFLHQLHSVMFPILLLVAFCGGTLSLFSFPFTEQSPVKLRFMQVIDLNSNDPQPVVNVIGDYGYVSESLQQLPSLKLADGSVSCENFGIGQERCRYVGPRPWSVAAEDYNDWLDVKVVDPVGNEDWRQQGPSRGEIEIRVPDNRLCYLMFNTTRYDSSSGVGTSPVKAIRLFHGDLSDVNDTEFESTNDQSWRSSDKVDVLTRSDGIRDFTVHKLNWTYPGYHIGFDWVPGWFDDGNDRNERLGVTVMCHWGEYDEEIEVDGELVRKVPAFDEILQYAPRWTSWVNTISGMVRVSKYVEL